MQLLTFIFITFVYVVLWIYCLIDVIRSNFKDQNMKVIWILILLFAHLFGPLAYLIIGKSSKLPS